MPTQLLPPDTFTLWLSLHSWLVKGLVPVLGVPHISNGVPDLFFIFHKFQRQLRNVRPNKSLRCSLKKKSGWDCNNSEILIESPMSLRMCMENSLPLPSVWVRGQNCINVGRQHYVWQWDKPGQWIRPPPNLPFIHCEVLSRVLNLRFLFFVRRMLIIILASYVCLRSKAGDKCMIECPKHSWHSVNGG